MAEILYVKQLAIKQPQPLRNNAFEMRDSQERESESA